MAEFDRAFFSSSPPSPSLSSSLYETGGKEKKKKNVGSRVVEVLGSIATSASSWLGTAFQSSVDYSGSGSGGGGGGEDEATEFDQETEMAYLTFSWWLTHVGWKEIGERVKMAVEEVVGPFVHTHTPLPLF